MGHNRNVGHKKKVMSFKEVYKTAYNDGYREGYGAGRVRGSGSK